MYIQDAYVNIIFLSSMTMNGYEFQFIDNICNVYLQNKFVGNGYIEMDYTILMAKRLQIF